MFLTLDDAAAAFAEILDPPHIAETISWLEPVQGLFATGDPVTPADSQLGGTPFAGAGVTWPAVDPAAVAPGTLSAGSPEANAAMRAHLDAAVPMSFVARIEMSDALAIPALRDLPDQGRLLFFHDFVLGPYENGTLTGRVIWDSTDVADLAPMAMPQSLVQAATAERASLAELDAQYEFEDGWDGFTTIYDTPGRQARLVAGFGLPSLFVHGGTSAPPALIAAIREGTADDDLSEALLRYEDAFLAVAQQDPPPALRLLSSGLPEQDDPRLDAVILDRFGAQHLDRAVWDEQKDKIIAAAAEWQVLAQVDISAWMGSRAEGQVYYLIRPEDLAAQRFDRVICVYQQS